MNFLKGMILVLIFFAMPYMVGDSLQEKFCNKNHNSTIASTNTKAIKKEKQRKYYLTSTNILAQFEARRTNKNSNITFTDFTQKQNKQFNNILKYIYSKSFLENKSELALLQLKFQKHTNAP